MPTMMRLHSDNPSRGTVQSRNPRAHFAGPSIRAQLKKLENTDPNVKVESLGTRDFPRLVPQHLWCASYTHPEAPPKTFKIFIQGATHGNERSGENQAFAIFSKVLALPEELRKHVQ